MKIKLRKPKKSKHVEDLYVPGEEVVLENVIRFRSQQKQNWQLGQFLVVDDSDRYEIKQEQHRFVEIDTEGI